MSDALPPPRPPGPFGSPPGIMPQPAQVPAPAGRPKAVIVGLVAVGIAVVGLLMPWASVTGGFGASIDANGIDTDDGKVLAVLLAVMALLLVLALNAPRKGKSIAAGVISILATILAVYDYVDVKETVDDLNSSSEGFAFAEVGTGLYLCIIGCAIAAIASFMAKDS